MKIVEIIPQLGSGGAERLVVDLCNELVREHEVTLIVLHATDRTSFFGRELSEQVTLISMSKKTGFDVGLFYRLYKEIRRLEPDVVHTHLKGLVYSLLPIALLSGIRWFHTLHTDANKEAVDVLSVYCRKLVFGWRWVVPITISETSQASFTRRYGQKSVLIYNGCRPYVASDEALVGLEAIRPNSVRLLNVARMQPEKNQLALAYAVRNLNERGYMVDLMIVGREDKEILSNSVFSVPYIHILGERKNPRDYMLQSDAFVLSSLYEGMPITLIECMSIGGCPICTPVGGIVDMVRDGENGILSKGTSVQELEEAIIRFWELSPEHKEDIAHRNRELFDTHYSIKNCVEHYLSLFSI